MECFGCKLANNLLETYIVYENETVNVILDRFPFSYGHILILPKDHYESIDDLPDSVIVEINKVAKLLKPILMKAFDCPSVIMMQNNGAMNSLKHYHHHLIPYRDEDLTTLYDTSIYMDNSDDKLQQSLNKIKEYL